MMKYFSGFSLQGEENFFTDILIDTDMCIAGFSYGAQKALEYAFASKERIDRLILISPAFFQTQKSSFMRAQLKYFEADKKSYTDQFLKNAASPSSIDLCSYLHLGSKEELGMLLNYVWDQRKIQALLDKGIVIEVFLGSEDKIIDANAALMFFSPLVTTYFVKGAGHLLARRDKT